ncbi:MAG: Holliday junction branch migration protein RuvA [Minisyncoccia bacterium]
MIREIRGKVLSVEPFGATVEVAGFGIFVHLPNTSTLVEGKEASLKTYLAVKQDGLELYGFLDEADRRFFELTLSVSGVGPKTALSLLRRAPREKIEEAIAKRDIAYLTRVVGLGKKSAEKLMVEIGERINLGGNGGVQGDDAEVFDTLVALGYTEREARKTLTSIPENVVGKDARLKAALSLGSR